MGGRESMLQFIAKTVLEREILENSWFIQGLGIKMNNLKINNCTGWAISWIYLLVMMAMLSTYTKGELTLLNRGSHWVKGVTDLDQLN